MWKGMEMEAKGKFKELYIEGIGKDEWLRILNDFIIQNEYLDSLSIDEWKEIIEKYFLSSKATAEILEVSVPRVYALEESGQLHSVVKGKFLKSEVDYVAKTLPQRRRKYRRVHNILTTETIYDVFIDMYRKSKKPIAPKELIRKVETSLAGCDQVIVKYRVTNALRILIKKGIITRIKKGYYEPIHQKNEP